MKEKINKPTYYGKTRKKIIKDRISSIFPFYLYSDKYNLIGYRLDKQQNIIFRYGKKGIK